MNPGKESIDLDRLPDDILTSIFNKLRDAKSLCISMSVCKRFRYIVPRVSQVFVSVPLIKKVAFKEDDDGIMGGKGFKNLVVKTLMKSFHFFSQMMILKRKSLEDDSDSVPFYEILKPFEEIRVLHLKLPCYGFQKPGEYNGYSRTFLKWKAEFGSQLHSCVILGARSWSEDFVVRETEHGLEQEWCVIGNREMKLRIVWMISCLIAASARHYLVQETVKDLRKIESVMVSDISDQGMLCMNKEQIEELRNSKAYGMLDSRTRLPALSTKMWYAEKLELPGCGKAMEGATLVVIRPGGGPYGEAKGKSDADLVAMAFGGDKNDQVLGEFARKLMVSEKCYTLEMNSF